MKQDIAVLGYLGRALSFELSAIQHYISLSRILEIKGMPAASELFTTNSRKELQHVESIVTRMIALGVAPNSSQLRPPKLNGSLSDLIGHVLELQGEMVTFYESAVNHCKNIEDHENRIFFTTLLNDEREKFSEIEVWWNKLITT